MLIAILSFFLGFFIVAYFQEAKDSIRYLNSWSNSLDHEREALNRNQLLLRYLHELKERYPEQFEAWAEDELKRQEKERLNVC